VVPRACPWGSTNQQIGDAFGLRYSAVNRQIGIIRKKKVQGGTLEKALIKVCPLAHGQGFSFDPADMSGTFGKAMLRVPKELREASRSAAIELLGESGYRQLLADLEAKDEFKVAEPGASHNAFPGKMIQRRLFD